MAVVRVELAGRAYEVRVEMSGYSVLNQTGISLSVGQTVNLTLRMQVGQLGEGSTDPAGLPQHRDRFPAGRAGGWR